jgi:site-specific DNA recombinase
MTPTSLRCAVYTRKSTEEGLEQGFNSLHAQREACEAYIASQRHEGWNLVGTRYDDGGYSGGSMDRPGLKGLLSDIAERRIDIVIVYKVDRLTRSLTDFARMVELFDRHGISFVSVTQSFNTTTSMGRLTLNVLLSFAQFEREVTAERIRDKIAASKKKGIWMGGTVPLGYRVESRKLVIVPDDADTVRLIFRRYLELKSMDKLLSDLKRSKIKTKATQLSSGRIRGGIPFAKGTLGYLLGNRTYLGELKHLGKYHSGEHAPILDKTLFDAVQALRTEHSHRHYRGRDETRALLRGKLVDAQGRRYVPLTQKKGAARYRYYVRAAHEDPTRHAYSAPPRVSGPKLDGFVLTVLAEALPDLTALPDPQHRAERFLARVVLQREQLTVELTNEGKALHGEGTLTVPWAATGSRGKREVLGLVESQAAVRPIQAAARATLLTRIAQGRLWLRQLVEGEFSSIEELARLDEVTPRQVAATLSLAFLSPTIVAAAIKGRLPDGVGAAQFRDAHPDWQRQLVQAGLIF